MRHLHGSRLQLIALISLAFALPFELKAPIISLGPIVITNVEAILFALIVLWISGVLRRRELHWTLAHSAVLAWLSVQFLSALFAPIERDAALKFALRSAGGAALFFIAADWIRSGRRTAWIMSAIASGAVLSACAGVLEIHFDTAQMTLLSFKTQATLVGGQVRASGTFQYANTAAMYWEAALPVLIAVGVWWSIERAQRRWSILALAGSLIVTEALILSSSRAAMVSAGLVLGSMIIADRVSSIRSGVARPAALGLIALAALIGVQLFINPLLATRLKSESDDSWFQAVILPTQSSLTVLAGETITQAVVITNTSVRTWPSAGARPIYLSYHWIQPATRHVLIMDGTRTRLPRELAPGEGATIMASVEVPNMSESLTLQWDLVQEDVTWFGARGSPVAEVNVNVTSAQPTTEPALPPTPSRLVSTTSPPRAELWRAGVKIWLAYPLLGVGPDNFRHVYGTYLRQTEFDDRITANSWTVEILATTGVIGLIAGWWVVIAVAIHVRRQWWTLNQRSMRALALGLSAALLAFFLHGAVDYFMEFTPTYGLFWLIAGLLVGLLTGTQDVEFAGTADRV